ncbi:MAG: chitobiase/beta-hexosaminidase C-terminal domain-containing protein, partial [Treponema sp.]|nr:chitobiase/beta-hexosaminidase C-terminal domain-containing protein [Treponema sp.]
MKNLKKIAAGGFLLALVLGGCASPVEDSGPVSPPPSVETVARPAADPAAVLGATKALGSTVTLSSATPGAAIYYTTDGSDPGAGSTRYTSPISLTRAYTPIRAIAVKSGMNDSEILTAEYRLQQGSYVDGLRAAPGNGGGYPWSSPISPIRVARGSVVDLACNTTGADIYYTTNGSTPGVSSPVFNP